MFWGGLPGPGEPGQGAGLQVMAGWLLVALLGIRGGHCFRPWRRAEAGGWASQLL